MLDEIEKALETLHHSEKKDTSLLDKAETVVENPPLKKPAVQKITLGEKTVAEQLKEAEIAIEKKEPLRVEFLVDSDVYREMEDRLKQTAARIKKAINEAQPILIKHHADADGYCAGIALEKTILPLITKKYGPDSWKFFQRDPSKAPYYDYQDALRDISKMSETQRRFRVSAPLIIVLDNGSGAEDLPSIKKLQLYGAEIIVIDHHFPGILEEDVDYHINPYFFGGNKNITTTMMAVELAHILNSSVKDIQYLPAISGVADKSEGKEFEDYLKKAEMYRLDVELLKKIALCIDYEAFHIRFGDSVVIADLLNINDERWNVLIDSTYKEAKKRIDERLRSVLHYALTEQFNGITLGVIDIASVISGFDFPSTGKSVGLLHKSLVEEHGQVITLGYTESSVTVRSTKPFLLRLIKELQLSYDYADISGGGHDVAGTLTFAPAAKVEVLDAIVKWIKKNVI